MLGSSLTLTSLRGFLFSGRLGSSRLSHPFFSVWHADFKVYSCTAVCTTVISHVTLVMLSFQGSCLRGLMHCGSVSSGRAVTLIIVRISVPSLD